MKKSAIYFYRIPTPPSMNALWRITGRRMYRTKKYVEWIEQCKTALAEFQKPAIDYPFNIEIIVGRPSKRRMDIDNRAKAVMDMLQHLDIITDDCLANRVTMMWSNEINDCKVTIWHAERA
jgi:crossover junction endodeoxyribonuclease RusA